MTSSKNLAGSERAATEALIWLDGRVVSAVEATIPVLTHSLHYGSAVFEGIRVYDGRIFENEAHMRRLLQSARLLGYELPYTVGDLCGAAAGLLAEMGLRDAYIRPLAWRGSEDIDITGSNTQPRVMIAAWAWPNYYGGSDAEPSVRLTRAPWIRPAPDMIPLQSKASGHYVAATLNRQYAKQKGFSDCIVLDAQGRVVEATVANIFLVKQGRLVTPKPDGCLDGITRQRVLALAREAGIEAEVTDIYLDDVANADEVFLTGTAVEVMPVVQVDEHAFAIGPVTRRLRAAYDVLTGKRPA
jgi:branched-chain amino acid aminotransferase